MTSQIDLSVHHQLRFAPLFHHGQWVSIPCDASGEVNLNGLSDRLRNAYLGARALVGGEYARPTVEVVH
jgi:hypothetical protein